MGGGSACANGLESMQPGQKRPAKLFHKKSRTGCQRCRARRVKCDEAKPICSNCTRLHLTCLYDRVKPADHAPPPPLSSPSSSSSPSAAAKETADPGSAADPPESEARRKLELSLFYQYLSETGPSIAVDEASLPLWADKVPQLALGCNALLYSLFLVAALHRAKKSNGAGAESGSGSGSGSLDHHASAYLDMAVRELGREIEHLSPANVDAVCLAASVLRIYTFVRLQERELRDGEGEGAPYAPPTSWLRMTGTSAAVFRRSATITAMDPGSIGMQMVGLVADLLGEGEPRPLEGPLAHLLRRQLSHELEEPWDAAVRDAYLSALNCVAAVWAAMLDRRPPGSVARRLVVFPLLVDARFVDMVDEKRPRALVVMAHYFALLAMLRGFWWVGDAGPREVKAIAKHLPAEWQAWLRWPLEILKDQIVFTHDIEVDRLSEYAAGLSLHI
ncbi:Sterol regulatory element-binding protein ECM22 [Metarhizium anisopliae]|nr:Sterol regulatory element-binding protein ECM22 [Metarhizium anisopliae]